MDKDTMVLKDGTIVELEAGAGIGNITVVTPDKASMLKVWESFTEDSLSEVRVKNGAGLTVGRYTDLVLVSGTFTEHPEGVSTSFCFREKDRTEKRLDAIEEGQTVQDGTIMDMAEAVSTMTGA